MDINGGDAHGREGNLLRNKMKFHQSHKIIALAVNFKFIESKILHVKSSLVIQPTNM
jgi:hypothetical protein